MTRNPILDLSLDVVLRPAIALPLQHVLRIYTVGQFLRAWRSPNCLRSVEQLFDSPEQARHAAQVCAAWIGAQSQHAPTNLNVTGCWRDEPAGSAAA
jgi:hypothetical protein